MVTFSINLLANLTTDFCSGSRRKLIFESHAFMIVMALKIILRDIPSICGVWTKPVISRIVFSFFIIKEFFYHCVWGLSMFKNQSTVFKSCCVNQPLNVQLNSMFSVHICLKKSNNVSFTYIDCIYSCTVQNNA